jgi:hypothetical protein
MQDVRVNKMVKTKNRYIPLNVGQLSTEVYLILFTIANKHLSSGVQQNAILPWERV